MTLKSMRRTYEMGAVLTLFIVLTSLVVSASARAAVREQPIGATTATVWLQNANSKKCLLVRGSAVGTGAVQITCAIFVDQRWTVHNLWDVGEDWLTIENNNSHKCLTVGNTSDNSRVYQANCNSALQNQRWKRFAVGGNLWWFQNLYSYKCLLVRGESNEAPVVQFTCANFADQYWFIADSRPCTPAPSCRSSTAARRLAADMR